MPNQTAILDTPTPEVNDLIGNPPSWLLKSGISMVALVTFIILTMSYFFEYPDKIQGVGSLTSSSPPIKLVSGSRGYIEELLTNEGEQVTEGERLIYIKNTTNPGQIELLLSWIDEYEAITDPRDYLKLNTPQDLQLGIIQNDYAALHLKFDELQQTLKYYMPFQQINTITEETTKIEKLNQSQRKEKEIYASELALEEKDFKRNASLEGDIVSTQEVERAKTRLLQKQRQYESMENAIIQNNIKISNLELEKLKIQGDRANLIKSYQFNINEIIARIKSDIEDWNQTYSITAPISGKISLIDRYHKNATVEPGDLLGYILPAESSENYFISQVPIYNIGKVKAGQKVLIKLDAYPYKEFGSIRSTVAGIGSLPQQDKEENYYYEVKVAIPDSIVTDIGHPIPFKPNMTAQLEIITKDKTVLERLFSQILSLIKQQEQ